MAAYGGRSFNVYQQGSGLLPQWTRESNVTVRHYAGGAKDNIQFGGQGNYKMEVQAYVPPSVATSTEVASWQALVNGTARTLSSLWGQTFNNVYLIGVGEAQWHGIENFYTIPLTFMRLGA